MAKILKLKPILNKKNGQININLPRKKIPIDFLNNLIRIKKIKLKLEGWE